MYFCAQTQTVAGNSQFQTFAVNPHTSNPHLAMPHLANIADSFVDVAQQLTLGLAYKSTSGLLVEADIKWINFSDTIDSIDMVSAGGTNAINFGWDDQIVYSLGVQKQVSDKMKLRFGVNYGASPIEEEDVNNNLGSVAIPELHLSLGATRQLSKRVSGSLSYTHAFENDLTSNTTPNMIKISQDVVYAQVAYQF